MASEAKSHSEDIKKNWIEVLAGRIIGSYTGYDSQWKGWQAALIKSKRQNTRPKNPRNDCDEICIEDGISHIQKKGKPESGEYMDTDGSSTSFSWPNHEGQVVPEGEAFKATSYEPWYDTDEWRLPTAEVVACATELVKSCIVTRFSKFLGGKVSTVIIKLVLSILDLEDVGNAMLSEKRNSKRISLFNKLIGHFEDGGLSSLGVATMSREELVKLSSKNQVKAKDLIAEGALGPDDFAELNEGDVFQLLTLIGRGVTAEDVYFDEPILPYPEVIDTDQVIKAMGTFAPLKVDYKVQLNLDLADTRKCEPILDYLFVEACKGFITTELFEELERRLEKSYGTAESVLSPFLRDLHTGIYTYLCYKCGMLNYYEEAALFPLRSKLFGEFAEEVIEVVMAADHERRILGHRFVGVHVILCALSISRVRNHELVKSGMSTSSHDKPPGMPPYKIYKHAGDCAKHFGDESVRLEHLVMAVISVKDVNRQILMNDRLLKCLRNEKAELNDNLDKNEFKFVPEPIAHYETLVCAIKNGFELPDIRCHQF